MVFMQPAGKPDEDLIIQAVVLADSFNERFMPITLDKPRCLLPLVNVPIIEYTLEFLAVSGIQEVILYCRSHADQIREYVNGSRWNKPSSTLSIQVVVGSGEGVVSVGDALRDIDSKSLVTGDFVLCSADIVSNLNIGDLLKRHQQARKKDKNFIMTMITRQADPDHRTREHAEGAVFMLSGDGFDECVGYYPVDYEECLKRDRKLAIDMEKPFQTALNTHLKIRYDLLDTGIDICALNVLALFTENFDYMDVRRDFCRGVLTSDLMGHKLRVEVIDGLGSTCGYAARVRDQRLYDAISRDIISRWAFPVVPERNLQLDDDSGQVKVNKGLKYISEGVLLGRSCQIGKNTVIAESVMIGEGTRVQESVIGRGVQIGANCVIDGAYLWDGVQVESGSVIRKGCIIADRSKIKQMTTILENCLITADVVVGPRVSIPQGTRIAKWSDRLQSLTLEDDLMMRRGSATVNLGADADGVVYEEDIAKDDLESCGDESTVPSPIPSDHTCSENDEFEDEDDYKQQVDFQKEATEMAKNSINQNHAIDNAALELNSLKFACNASFEQCRLAVVSALVSVCTSNVNIQNMWGKWAGLLKRFVFSPLDMANLMDLIHTAYQEQRLAFAHVVPVLYQHDVLDGDVIIDWQLNNRDPDLVKFVEWLEEDDEEESDDSDGDCTGSEEEMDE